MKSVAVDFRRIVHLAAPVALAVVLLSGSRLPSRAEAGHMLVIPASDGYGFDDCLSGNQACGRVIADAWCEAHGMNASTSFGRADDVTASVRTNGAQTAGAKIEPGSFIVNCKD